MTKPEHKIKIETATNSRDSYPKWNRRKAKISARKATPKAAASEKKSPFGKYLNGKMKGILEITKPKLNNFSPHKKGRDIRPAPLISLLT
ncbi:hypothetical protein D9M70_607410 [compost metagenome]